MIKNLLLTPALTLLTLMTSPAAHAEDLQDHPGRVLTVEAVDDTRYAISIIRGDAALALYNRLNPRLERVHHTSSDGTETFVRETGTLACTHRPTMEPVQASVCAFAIRDNGTTLPIIVPPGMITTPRMGIGN